MNTKPAHDPGHPRSVAWYRSPGVIAGLMLAAIALFFLLREHWAHVSGNWVYLILLLVYGIASHTYYSDKHKASRKRVKRFMRDVVRLEKMYGRDAEQ